MHLRSFKALGAHLSFYLPGLVISSLARPFLLTFLFLTISLPHSAALILNLPLNFFTLSVTHVSNRQSSQWPSTAILRELSPASCTGKEAPAPKGNRKHTRISRHSCGFQGGVRSPTSPSMSQPPVPCLCGQGASCHPPGESSLTKIYKAVILR